MLNIYLKLLEKVVVHNQGLCHPQRTSDDIWDIFVCHNRGRGGGGADAAGTQCAEVSDGVNILQCLRRPPQKGIIHPNVNNVKVVKSLHIYGLPRWHNGKKKKKSTCNVRDTRDLDSIPGSGRFPGGEHGYSLQYSCLGNSMDRGA